MTESVTIDNNFISHSFGVIPIEETWVSYYLNGEKTNYEISSFGRVRSLFFGRIKMRKLTLDDKGYVRISIYHNKKDNKKRVHQVVATSFNLPNPCHFTDINHLDTDKSNNRIDNLQWCDDFVNMKHASINGLLGVYGEKNHRSKNIGQYKNGELIKTYSTIRETEKDGFVEESVSRAARLGFKHYGFNWKYIN